jgi:hypothetical protein
MQEYIGEIVVGLIALISGLVTGVFSRKNKSDDQLQKILDRYEGLIEKLEKKIAALESEQKSFRQQIKELREDNDLLSAIHIDHPFPFCVVLKDGIMKKYNASFYRTYLRPLGFDLEEAEGMHLIEIFGLEIGLEYEKGWEMVHRTGQAVIFAERVLQDPDDVKNVKYQKFIKYPLFAGEGTYAGVLLAYEDITQKEYENFKPKKLKYYN